MGISPSATSNEPGLVQAGSKPGQRHREGKFQARWRVPGSGRPPTTAAPHHTGSCKRGTVFCCYIGCVVVCGLFSRYADAASYRVGRAKEADADAEGRLKD